MTARSCPGLRRSLPSIALVAALGSFACGDDDTGSGGGGAGGAATTTSGSTSGPSTGETTSSSSTSSTGDGGGGGTPCEPGSMRSCYSGPPGTDGVGICAGGTETCLPDGAGYGACTGEVLPAVEDCASPADEDCSGAAEACSGDTLWSKRFGNEDATGSGQGASGLAFDAQGNMFIAGGFDGELDFGPAGVLDSGGAQHGFVAKLDPDGVPIWAHAITSSYVASISDMAIDPAGNVAVVGSFQDDIDGGGGLITGDGGNWDVFLVALDTDGGHRFTRTFGSSSDWDVGRGIDVAPDGSIAITGEFSDSINFGGNQLTASSYDAFVAIFDDAGSHRWSRRFGDSNGQSGWDVGFLPDGDVAVTGYNTGTIDLGGGPLTTQGLTDIFVGRLEAADGAHVYSRSFGNPMWQDTTYLTTDAQGNVVLVTYGSSAQSSTIDFGTGPQSGYFFIAKLDDAGATVWARGINGLRGLSRAAVDPLGAVVVCGAAEGPLDLGGGNVQSYLYSSDVLVAKYAGADGAYLWDRVVGDSNQQASHQSCGGVDTDAAGVIGIAGTFWGNTNFGDGELVSGMGYGGSDVFVAKLAP